MFERQGRVGSRLTFVRLYWQAKVNAYLEENVVIKRVGAGKNIDMSKYHDYGGAGDLNNDNKGTRFIAHPDLTKEYEEEEEEEEEGGRKKRQKLSETTG